MPGFDAPLANAMIDLLSPADPALTKSRQPWVGAIVLDWGCGRGEYLQAFRKVGAFTIGVEPLTMNPFGGHVQIRADIAFSHIFWPGVAGPERPETRAPFVANTNLTLCIEVLEHIPREAHESAIANLYETTHRYLVFSGAHVGQGGYGHIGERPEEEWRSLLEGAGFRINSGLTDALRKEATLPWLRQNVMVAHRPHEVTPVAGLQ